MQKKFCYLFLISFLCALTALPISADYVDHEAAPVSREFMEWYRIHSDNLPPAFRMSENIDVSEYSAGYRPSPVDTTHLSRNLPGKKFSNRNKAMYIPEAYDLRNQNIITEVKNQYPYGSCWTFGSFAAMESNYILQNLGQNPDLSELHLAWFNYKDPEPGNSFFIQPISQYGKDLVLDQGGNDTMTTAYMARMTGPVNEASLTYDKAPNMSSLSQNPEDYHPVVLRLADSYTLGELAPDMSSEERQEIITEMKALMMLNGALAMSYYAGEGATSPNNSVTAYFDNSNGNATDHIVAIIGWDDNFDRTKFNSDINLCPKNNGAWLVKNSWGKNWGDNGYFYISYEQYIREIVSYVVKANQDGIKHYGHDALGYIYDFSRVWSSNVFKAETWNEGINEIGFYTTDHNSSFDVYIFDLGTDTPSKPVPADINSPLYVKTGIEVDYAGYHTMELEDLIPLSKDHYFSVIIRMYSRFDYPTAIEMPFEGFAEPVVNSSESWFAKDTSVELTANMSWDDGKNGITFADDTLPTPMNACIKVFTLPLTVEGISVSSENFPDDNFKAYISENFDTNSNTYLSEEEISSAKTVSVTGQNIATLKGIEYLASLEELNCSKNNIEDLDLQYNSELKILNCSENKLKVLDLTKNTKITADNLLCSGQKISDEAILSETFSDDGYEYIFDLSSVFSKDIYEKISDVKALNIETRFHSETHSVEFKEKPSEITYYYSTGVNNALMAVSMPVSSELKAVKPIIKTSEILPEAKIGEEYEQELIAKGTGTITWSKTSGDLPGGLELSTEGKISGTPEKAGTFRFEATARNDTGTTSADFSIKVLNQIPALTVNTVSQSVTAGEGNFNVIFTATQGTNFNWFTSGILPSGVSFETEDKTFSIFGTPALTEAGKTFTYTVTASNDAGYSRQTVKLNVKNVAPVFNEVATSYNLDTSKNVRITLTATKGTNIKWTTSGTLPTGLTGKESGANNFRIEGTPADTTKGNEYDYTVTASNDVGFASKKFSFKVSEVATVPESQQTGLDNYLDTLSDEELSTMTTLVIPENVKDLSGLENIEGLPTLDFSKNGIITEVNLDGNDTVENLIFSRNSGVKILNIANSRVKRVEARNSNLEEVDIEGSTFIEYLDVRETLVTSMNAKNCVNLKTLLCSDSEIGFISIEGCVSLRNFECDGNRIAKLDCEEFNFLNFACYGQEVEGWTFSREMNFSDYIITSIFLSNSEEIEDENIYSAYFGKISSVQGYDSANNRIPTTYDSNSGQISFSSVPVKLTYNYNTGFENELMDVTVTKGNNAVSNETETRNNAEGAEGASGGGGCGIGFNLAGLILILAVLLKLY